ncbi:MAG: hypothetical protein HY899_02060 [Deltaproteobacteria bacterium]|nr:hypothetical protein [Deltaproteobacteria bacterium]
MGAAMIALPFVLFTMLFLPWVALLAVPLATVAVSGTLIASAMGRRFAAARTVEVLQEGLLALMGLSREPRLEASVRGAVGRALGFAPAGTRASACACVKPSGGSFVGILRIWNARGQYLLRTPGSSVAAVANAIVEQLSSFGDQFPAREGAALVRVHECDPRNCPLRQVRLMAQAHGAMA